MLDTVTATTFMRKMKNGKTTPLLVRCELDNGEEIEVVAKLSGNCERRETALAVESICAMLAADLELPVPEPFIVRLDPEIVDQDSYPDIYRFVATSCPLAFGSKLLPNGYALTMRLLDPLLPMAAEIFTFDAMALNSDRRVDNPNCQSNGKSLAIFDHEMCLITDYLGTVMQQFPWVIGALEHMRNGQSKHIFFDELSQKMQNLDDFGRKLASIQKGRYREYIQALPAEWVANQNTIQEIEAYLNQVNTNWSLLRLEVERVWNA